MLGKHEKLWKLYDLDPKIGLRSFRLNFIRRLEYDVGKYKRNTKNSDIYQALALTIRDTLINRWNEVQESYRLKKTKRIYYISMEFLVGTLLESNLVNIGMREIATGALIDFGYDLEMIAKEEHDAALGNGGLGRLAACFLESMATLDLPSQGCGIRYEYGIFHQQIQDGYQKEAPDNWLSHENPWEISRLDLSYPVHFYGHLKDKVSLDGSSKWIWVPGETVIAQAYDMLVPGFNTRTVTNLRLWKAKSGEEFNFDYFNHGDYLRAVEDKEKSENITKVLYPNDNILQGKELRLKQEYLLVSATLQDAMRTFLEEEGTCWERFPERVFFQLNDTHPTLAIPECMRLLIDRHGLQWEEAWSITTQCFGYTNHTIMPEALETWSIDLFGWILPRHLEIIYAINYNFLEGLRKRGVSEDVIKRLSIVEESTPKKIRMAHLAIVGSKKVNGVARIHTELIKKKLFPEFHSIFSHKFENKTNGITYRRWLLTANQRMSEVITRRIGNKWYSDLSKISKLEEFSADPSFQREWMITRKENKVRLATVIQSKCDVTVDPNSMFDVHVKRIHEYKRQHLNALRLIHDYYNIKENPSLDYTPRTVIFAGKAAPGYYLAKLIIKLIHSIADVINNDKQIGDRLKVVFLPDYRVSLAELIFPAADLSEQISTAGTEASGTGNMKFMLNGALTIGTMDGANIEIYEEVGDHNIFIFGKTIEELEELKRAGYFPTGIYESNPMVRTVLDEIMTGKFYGGKKDLFKDIFLSLTKGGDPYFLLADFESYLSIQEKVAIEFKDKFNWNRRAIINMARSGRFSADRTVQEYAKEIWEISPVRQKEPRIKAV
ncbi:glycogen phosphorylase [Leptospira perolatii]|uniref:Alpha-1,4 glucan phosphorylase n=1 Tax=Leptospira perolatii TaxID=2023191 RepID=A0A2M9ZNV1_9LEPT|nr:glycogen phosphorylase [Leptospira perolatii]PJZ73714.1 glycogen phosphorylase [Leptospira perolatii]